VSHQFSDGDIGCDQHDAFLKPAERSAIGLGKNFQVVGTPPVALVADHSDPPDAAPLGAMNEPRGPKQTARRLAQRAADALVGTRLGSIHSVRTDQPLVALTFDDGPDPKWTPRMLDVLAGQQAHATFFMLVESARALPKLVRRVVAEGHEVGLHGLDHRSLAGGSRRSTRCLLEAAASELAAISGTPITYFRPPFCAQTVASFLGARDAGLETVVYNLDSFDWSGREEQQVASGVVIGAAPGSVVVLHDRLATDPRCAFDRSTTLQLVVDGLQRRSLHSTTLSRLIASGKVRRTAWFSLRAELGRWVST
jgi:peptidoglycan/xylan/chitin deacetylase (PgdA/CDA1 family)